MYNQLKPKNPWNKNVQQPKKNNRNSTNSGNSPTPSDIKFKDAQSKLQAAVQKHLDQYESSSDEDEQVDSTNFIEDIFKHYQVSSDETENIIRTQGFIEQTFQAGASTCLICISKIKKDDQIWSCCKCYGFFHLTCIQRWSKDTIAQQKNNLEDHVLKPKIFCWCCPKCRNQYDIENIPTKYLCFCKKTENPKYQPFLVPHSCGEICMKDLIPSCGHKCTLLCHPGPCPPCPRTVSVKCYCGQQPPRIQRCSRKNWSCGNKCGKILECGKHVCFDPCHEGKCSPCPKKSFQKCVCSAEQKLRDCAFPVWHCELKCNILLDCGYHDCQEICHQHVKNSCPLTESRSCPCGKQLFTLPCIEKTPTCFDTCEKLLDCGVHTCSYRCHKEKCGPCLEIVIKYCRCGQHSKEIQCCKSYLCETKCKRMKDCNKHPCNRKCCEGHCPPCEKPCGKTLSCGTHKCSSVCHRGPCYPCNQTDTIACRCGSTKLVVPCGRKYKTKPPKCSKLCEIPPDCHHQKRDNHRCHFGDCPPCKQTCNKNRTNCLHQCSAPCHSAVWVNIEGQKASMPWEQTKPLVERRDLPCPNCEVPVQVTCLGEHEIANWPCYMAKRSSCQRPCGRLLFCNNHTCTQPCHSVIDTKSPREAGKNCEECEEECSKERPEGCTHPCPKPCHPGDCPPCKNMLRVKCHCGLNQLYVNCKEWIYDERKEDLQCCGNQCPKKISCGHRCKLNCHSGPCPNPELCKKKVKVACPCKRIRKEFSCESVRNKTAAVKCNEVCEQKKKELMKMKKALEEQRLREEEEKNKKEFEKFLKMFEGKKKVRDRPVMEEIEQMGYIRRFWTIIVTVLIVPVILGIYVSK